MSDSGEWLETLVKEIESNLLPVGFTTTGRKRVYNENGRQVAEFDIEIMGKLGSGQIKWLIECRDRGSGGPEPAAWIEQLVGRRDRFNFNQVTAVSTAGFSEGAVQYANERRIELRTVDELNYDRIAEWFQFQHVDYINCFGELKYTEYHLDDFTTEQELEKARESGIPSDSSLPIFYDAVTGQRYSIENVFRFALNSDQSAFDGLQPGIDKKMTRFIVDFSSPDQRHYITFGDKSVKIKRIVFFAELSIVNKKIPIAQITEYTDLQNQQSIAQTVRFSLPPYIQEKNLDLIFHRYSEDGANRVILRVSDEVKRKGRDGIELPGTNV